MNQDNFLATFNLDEAAFNLIIKGLNLLPTGEAGDICYLMKQSFAAQKQQFYNPPESEISK